MEKKWTVEQQNAIHLQKDDLLVSAGAGSGKTAVLVERILSKIADPHEPVDLSSLLIVTFTRAAASEMRERISKAIYTRLSMEPNNEHLVKQMMQLPICDITTIDSFCMATVKNNASVLDIDSSFGIFENVEAEMIKDEVLDTVLEDMYARPTNEFLAFANNFSGLKSDDPLKRMIITSYSFLRSLPFYIDWLGEKIRDYEDAKGFSRWSQIILSYAKRKIEICLDNYGEILTNFPEDDKNKSAREILLAEKVQCADIYHSIMEKDWDSVAACLSATSFSTLRMKIEDAEQKAWFKKLRDDAKSMIMGLKSDYIFLDKETCQKDMISLYPILCGYFEVIKGFDSTLFEMKTQKNMYEFSDLEHLTLKLLSVKEKDGFHPSSYAKEIGLSYSEILIDEYQDTNALQEMIFMFLGKGCQHFYVGDLKQSIYKFRHANPYIFKEKKDTYSDDIAMTQVKINLVKNFRSRAGVLDSINQIFSDIMSARLGDLDYKDGESLLCAAPYGPWTNGMSDKTEIFLIDTATDGDSAEPMDAADEAIAELTKAEKEALPIAKEIKNLMAQNFQVEKDGHLQKIEFRDIVILMRSPGPVSEEFSRVLLAEGIPVYSDTGGQYFNATEVATMISILEIIDNPLNDISLVAALRSAIFYFNDNELLEIKMTGELPNFYHNLCEKAQDDSPLGEKCSHFLEILKSWQNKSTYLSVSELIWTIYEDTDFFAICAVMANAQKKIGNLRILYHKAKQYEDHNFRGLYHFIDFIKRVRLGGGDMSEAKIMAENQNVVRIMSIHKSKGLEFPVVFCAGLGKRFNERFKHEKILMHSNLGIGMDYMDQDIPYGYPNISKIAITLESESENLSEEMRLLYVAMTRAKEKLYLTATIKDCEKMFDKWQPATTLDSIQFLDYLLTSKHFIHWIMPTVLKTNHISSYSQLLSETDSQLFVMRLIKDSELFENTEPVKDDNTTSFSHDETIIQENFAYRYPFIKETEIPNKLSVSELSHDDGIKNMYDEKVLLKTPSFKEKGSMPTPSQIGTLNHLVMQKIDLSKTTIADVNECIDRLVFEHIIDPDFAPFIDREEIASFFESELGKRLCHADRIFREISFEIPKSLQDIYQDTTALSNETILVQGIIDCFFYEGDDIVLIDYKTNAAHLNQETVKEKYQTQISIYAEAIKIITKKEPKEKFIYLFSSKDVIEYD